MNNRFKAYLVIAVFFAISLTFWFYSDAFALWSKEVNPFVGMVVSLSLHPEYAFVFLAMWLVAKKEGIGVISSFFASILFIAAIDIISLAHTVYLNGILPAEPALYPYVDTFIYRVLPMPTIVLYVIIPTLLVTLALFILRPREFMGEVQKLTNGVIKREKK